MVSNDDLPTVSGGGVLSGPSGEIPRIEGYEITACVGKGGMGVVWRAIQLSTKREVALKVMGVSPAVSERARRRFEREVELAAALEHPNIARVYDSGLLRGDYYYVMELIQGVPLDQYVRERRLSLEQILDLMKTVCEAVDHAHQRSVIHRDLKPSNILVTDDGQPHILDFGLAKSLLLDESREDLTVTDELAGTPAYMSPEQAAGRHQDVGSWTDVYGLAVITYRLLTGDFPHDLSGNRLAVIHRIATEKVRRPRQLNEGITRRLESILLKALSREPGRRHDDAGELGRDLGRYLGRQGTPAGAREIPSVPGFGIGRYVMVSGLLLMVLSFFLPVSRPLRQTQRAVPPSPRALRPGDDAREEQATGPAPSWRGEGIAALGSVEMVFPFYFAVVMAPLALGSSLIRRRVELHNILAEIGVGACVLTLLLWFASYDLAGVSGSWLGTLIQVLWTVLLTAAAAMALAKGVSSPWRSKLPASVYAVGLCCFAYSGFWAWLCIRLGGIGTAGIGIIAATAGGLLTMLGARMEMQQEKRRQRSLPAKEQLDIVGKQWHAAAFVSISGVIAVVIPYVVTSGRMLRVAPPESTGQFSRFFTAFPLLFGVGMLVFYVLWAILRRDPGKLRWLGLFACAFCTVLVLSALVCFVGRLPAEVSLPKPYLTRFQPALENQGIVDALRKDILDFPLVVSCILALGLVAMALCWALARGETRTPMFIGIVGRCIFFYSLYCVWFAHFHHYFGGWMPPTRYGLYFLAGAGLLVSLGGFEQARAVRRLRKLKEASATPPARPSEGQNAHAGS